MKLKDCIPFDNSNCPECKGKSDADGCRTCYYEHDKHNKKYGYNVTWSWCEQCQDHANKCGHPKEGVISG